MNDAAINLPAWPFGTSEMARLIRVHDWFTTPLGLVENWPQSLRTAVDIVLAIPGPASILWGPAHVQIYNDAYIALAADRHPAMLGRSAAENWPEVHAEVLAPVMQAAFAGRATTLANFSVVLRGPEGRMEERAFDTTWSPIPEGSGVVGGALQILVEVTDRCRGDAILRESEARHRLLIQSWAQAVWEADANGLVIADSPSWRAYTGQSLKEWLGYGWLDAIHPDDRAYAEQQWRKAIMAQGFVDTEFRLRAPDGGWQWTNIRATPVLDANGHVEKWAGMNINIDARKRVEAALRESEERFRAFAENSADTIWITNGEGTRLEYLSPAFEHMFGEPRGPILADIHRWVELVHPDDREEAQKAMPRALAGETTVVHYRVVRPSDGSVVHTRDAGFPIRDEKERIVRVAGIVQDVTDMVRAGEALEGEKERFRTLAEGISPLVWRCSDEGLWTWASPQWQNYTGQSDEESRNWGWLDAVHAEDRERSIAAWHEARLHGRLDLEHRVRRAADGAWRWHQTRSTPIRGAAEPGGAEAHILEWLGTTTDIDDLKRLQGEQQVLVAELQHRTRNLLAVVRNVARRSIDPSPQRNEYDARLAALGRVQGFLSRSPGYSASLGDVVEAELHAVGDGALDRIETGGPAVDLPGESVQAVALALHELVTNAVKYGALAQSLARLSVNWYVEAGADDVARLVIDWRESGVTMPPGLPAHRGYGSELITRALPYQLRAETALEFTPDGVHCRIVLPSSTFNSRTERQVV